MSDELLTVVVPCLNEEAAVRPTVDEIMSLAPTLPVRVEVLMVDDGSTDGTRRVMEELCERYPAARMLVNATNLGAGRAAMKAFEGIDRESWITCIPGDNEMMFESIRGFLDIRKDYDLILGYLQNPVIRPLVRRFASNAFTVTTRMLYGYPYRYLNGVKMYRRWVFEGIETISGGHAINAELIAKAILKHPLLRIGEAAFVARGRARGHSKAFRPASIATAVRETYQGYREVVRYREEAIRRDR